MLDTKSDVRLALLVPFCTVGSHAATYVIASDKSPSSGDLTVNFSLVCLHLCLPVLYRRSAMQRSNIIATWINPYPTAFPYGNGMVLHFFQQQENSTTKTVHKVINKRLKTYV